MKPSTTWDSSSYDTLENNTNAQGENTEESRMREIRTSGLTRGWGSGPTLLYCPFVVQIFLVQQATCR